MQSTVESWKQIDPKQFFDDLPFPDEDLQPLTKIIKEPAILSIEELERLIKLFGESQILLSSGETELTQEIRYDLWKVVTDLFRLRLLSVATNSSNENRRCAALWQLSQMENDEKTLAFFDKIANAPATPEKVAKVAREAKLEAISILAVNAKSAEEIELSPEEAEIFHAMNDALNGVSKSLDRLIAAVRKSADDYAAATKRMEKGAGFKFPPK